MAYGFFFMASYPMVEAAVMNVVPASVRGRAFGLWITIGGLIGNLSHWLVGSWVEELGPLSNMPQSYYSIYVGLAGLLLASLLGLFFLDRVGRHQTASAANMPEPSPASPASETLDAPPLQ
jgi:hypothetical protein